MHAREEPSAELQGLAAGASVDPDRLALYRAMRRIRCFEEATNDLYMAAKMPGLAHLYIGQEAVAVGVCSSLQRTDYITSTHRGHGHCLAKGASLEPMFAELLGKEAGYCGGKGGSMHIADQASGNLGANAIVGGSCGIATGAALSAKMRGSSQVAVCFFGDGALGQGVLYEVMNMASLWSLPVIYVCEDNQYGEYTHRSETLAGDVAGRAEAFGVTAMGVDGQDVEAVALATREAVARARSGFGPSLLHCWTYRFRGHHVGDVKREYRAREEELEWEEHRDPIVLYRNALLDRAAASADELERVDHQVVDEVRAAVDWALAAAYPSVTEVDRDVYS